MLEKNFPKASGQFHVHFSSPSGHGTYPGKSNKNESVYMQNNYFVNMCQESRTPELPILHHTVAVFMIIFKKRLCSYWNPLQHCIVYSSELGLVLPPSFRFCQVLLNDFHQFLGSCGYVGARTIDSSHSSRVQFLVVLGRNHTSTHHYYVSLVQRLQLFNDLV